jgi:hypothetical protein
MFRFWHMSWIYPSSVIAYLTIPYDLAICDLKM